MTQLDVPGTDRRPGVPTIRLDDRCRDHLVDLLTEVRPSPYEDLEGAILEAFRLLPAHLSPEMVREIRRFAIDPDATAIILDNMPRDPSLPDTPTDGKCPTGKPTFVSEYALLGLAQFIGHPFAFEDERDGELIHQIVPDPRAEDSRSSLGSRIELELHTECTFSDLRPQFQLLGCVRSGGSGVASTLVVPAREIVARLPDDILETLWSAEYRVACPESFRAALGGIVYSEPGAIFRGPRSRPEVRFDSGGTEPLTVRAGEALHALRRVLPAVSIDCYLTPGQVLLLNNRACLHGRRSFRATYDGSQRWLQRVYVRTCLWEARDRVDHRLRVV
jgi:L-asparagine oxygenase